MKVDAINDILVDAIVKLAKQIGDDAHDMSIVPREDEDDYYKACRNEGLSAICILAGMVLIEGKNKKDESRNV